MRLEAKAFQSRLLSWFDASGRKSLPWQRNKTAYRVWVSEIMLQQTQVQTVIPYYERFMHAFPTVKALALAPQETVLSHWSGLGYYARARNLHATAQHVHSVLRGRFPKTLDGLIALPGIGRSTAGAILSIAYQHAHPILDGNVKRVLCRLFAIEGSPYEKHVEQQLWALATQYTPVDRVADYTQAMMDLGATLCTRTQPDCIRCPFKRTCRAHQTDTVAHYPAPRPKKNKPTRTAYFAICRPCELPGGYKDSRLCIFEKRPAKGIWGALWCFPEFKTMAALTDWAHTHNATLEGEGVVFKHTFTHFHLELRTIHLVCPSKAFKQNNTHRWIAIDALSEYGVPSPITKICKQFSKEPQYVS